MNRVRGSLARLYDLLQLKWESPGVRKAVGSSCVLLFLAVLFATGLRATGLLPEPAARLLPSNPFLAVYGAFILLLILEVIGLVFSLGRSVSDAVGKQFEILSLILLREVFVEFTDTGGELEWRQISPQVPVMAADALAAVAVFVCVGVYYRLQRHVPVTANENDQLLFVANKKLIGLALLAAFASLGALELRHLGAELSRSDGFADWWSSHRSYYFDDLFTVLIFADVLIVLLAFRYSSTYHVGFRNAGFAVATVFIRLALVADPYLRAVIAVGASAFIIALTLAYNAFAPALAREHVRQREQDLGEAAEALDPGREREVRRELRQLEDERRLADAEEAAARGKS